MAEPITTLVRPAVRRQAKGLPKRCRNDNRKNRRAACWKRGQQRKEERRKAQKVREDRNRELRKQGQLTPYQARKRQRLNEKYPSTTGGLKT